MQKKIAQIFKAKSSLFALGICGVFCVFWMVVAAHRYYFVDSGGWDNAVHVQTLWSLSHGRLLNSLLNANFIVEHCTFLGFLFAPFYRFCPHPLFLQYMKIGGFFAGTFIFFLILRKRFQPLAALAAMTAFSVAPANVGMLYFSFNYEPFSIPLVFLIFKFLDDENYKPYLASCFFLAMVKEQMPLVVMMLGISVFLFRKKDKAKWALVPFLMGALIFIAEVFVLMPYVRKGLPSSEVYYWARYGQFGQTPLQIMSSLFIHPGQTLQQLVSSVNIKWYKELFDGWGMFGIISPHILLPALPLFVKTLFSNKAIEHNVTNYYYAATFTPFIFMAAWNTVDYIKNKWRFPIHWLVIAGMFIHALIYMPYWLTPRYPVGGESNLLAVQKLIKEIPPEAPVMSGDFALAPLAYREKVYQFDSYLWDYYQISGLKFTLPSDTGFVLINFAEYDRLLFAKDNKRLIAKITALNFSDRWTLQESIEDCALFVRNRPKERANRLIEKKYGPFFENQKGLEIFDDTISLQEIEYPDKFSGRSRIFPVTMYWRSLAFTDSFYTVLIRIKSGGKVYYEKARPIGSVIYPTSVWSKGENVKEKYFYLLPVLAPGTYSIEIQVYDPQTHFYFTKNRQWINCASQENRPDGGHLLFNCIPSEACDAKIVQKKLFVE
ncbi:MAG: DUF2079 domain-containing protein [Candidatus Omnitrophica bacterium]|nr:DUF2079 domain-containing protein [Candidatus Omnitrophota bacterium]